MTDCWCLRSMIHLHPSMGCRCDRGLSCKSGLLKLLARTALLLGFWNLLLTLLTICILMLPIASPLRDIFFLLQIQLAVDKAVRVKLGRRLAADSRLTRSPRSIVARLGQSRRLGADGAERMRTVVSAIMALGRRRADHTKSAARLALRNSRSRRDDHGIALLHGHMRPLSIRQSVLVLAARRLQGIVSMSSKLRLVVVLEHN